MEALRGIEGNGKVVVQERSVSSFTVIDVGGAFEIELTQGDQTALTIEADENLLNLIITEVSGNTLEIYTKEDIRKFEKLKVYITFVELEELDLSGACEVYGNGTLQLDKLSCDVSGAMEMDLSLNASELTIDASGASEINLAGFAETVSIELSGAGELSAFELETDYFSLEISGAGDADIFVNKELDVEASGAASVRYKGSPDKVNHSSSGAGSIKKM